MPPFLLLASPAFPAGCSGQVVSLLDDDTIEVLHNTSAERIRLNSIDCPKKGQAYGTRVMQAASELVFGQEVTLQAFGKDKYRRTIADVLLHDGTNVNLILVKDDWCWWYETYAPDDAVLEELENAARAGRNGLRATPKPVPPWEWRKRGRVRLVGWRARSASNRSRQTSLYGMRRGPPGLHGCPVR